MSLPLLPQSAKYPLPDWEAIDATFDAAAAPDVANAFWDDRGREWVHLLRAAFGTDYRGYESANFWLISSQSEATCRRLLQWAETVRTKVLQALTIDPTGVLFGRCPILMLHDLETYYDYISIYYTDGVHALSGGVYLNRGYGHFVFTFLDLGQSEAVLAHELAHSLVSHLPLPLWLNEGVAQLSEIAVTGRDSANYDEIRATLDSFWTAETIQEFWTGMSFNRQDEGQMQSYHLAKVLTRRLTTDMARFRAFLQEADLLDAGTAALRKHFGVGLETLVSDYLGEGNWAPQLHRGE